MVTSAARLFSLGRMIVRYRVSSRLVSSHELMTSSNVRSRNLRDAHRLKHQHQHQHHQDLLWLGYLVSARETRFLRANSLSQHCSCLGVYNEARTAAFKARRATAHVRRYTAKFYTASKFIYIVVRASWMLYAIVHTLHEEVKRLSACTWRSFQCY